MRRLKLFNERRRKSTRCFTLINRTFFFSSSHSLYYAHSYNEPIIQVELSTLSLPLYIQVSIYLFSSAKKKPHEGHNFVQIFPSNFSLCHFAFHIVFALIEKYWLAVPITMPEPTLRWAHSEMCAFQQNTARSVLFRSLSVSSQKKYTYFVCVCKCVCVSVY